MKHPIVVIGAGAAGIIASWRAAQMGAKVILVEKTDRIGTKILISGGGKCNITHDGPIESVLKAFRPNEARFIRPACYRFLNTRIIEMLTDRGLRVYTREDGRIFPVDQTSKDVVAILCTYLEEEGVNIKLESPVKEIVAPGGRIEGVRTETELIPTNHIILCTGGSSYPRSGTTGDGWPWTSQLGHGLVPIKAALAPMDLRLKSIKDWAGVALRDIVLRSRLNGKESAKWRGDMLFTHHGISGPCTLGISRVIAEQWGEGVATVEVDLLPDHKFDRVDADLVNYKTKNPNRQIDAIIADLLPQRLVDPFLEQAGVEPGTKCQQLSKKQIHKLAEQIKGWSLGEVAEVILAKGEVVAGGVPLDEVDPHSMRSLKCPGLYLCGEIMDIAGPVGGYNLQAAWATGFVAGESAYEDWSGSSSGEI